MGFPQPDTGSVTEDVGVAGGFLTATGDVDYGPYFNNDAGQWTAQTISGSYGSQLVIDSDGVWTYTADNSNGTIQALDTGDTLTEVFTVSSAQGNTTVTITINGQDEPPCFVAGTLIDTPRGPRLVEELAPGDTVLTRDGGAQTLRWAGQRRVALGGAETLALQPIRLCRDAIAPGVPARDILLSPMHRVLLGGPDVQMLTGTREVLCPVGQLVNGQTIRRERLGHVSYHHLLFDDHQVVTSSGLESESFYPGRLGLDGFGDATRHEVFTLFPELRSLPESYGRAARYVTRGYEAGLLRESLKPGADFLELLCEDAA